MSTECGNVADFLLEGKEPISPALLTINGNSATVIFTWQRIELPPTLAESARNQDRVVLIARQSVLGRRSTLACSGRV